MVAITMNERRAVSPGFYWYITGVLFAAWVMAYVDRMVFGLLVPGVEASLHVSDTQVSLLQGSAFAIFYSLAGLPIGWLVDRTNRRNLLIVGVVGWSLSTIACGLAGNFGQLLAGRIAVGVFQAVLAPASLSMVADFCAPERRGRITGVLIAGASIGAALSSIAGGVILDLFATHPGLGHGLGHGLAGSLAPWQWTLVVVGAPGLIVALCMFAIGEPARGNGPGTPANFNILKYLVANRATFVPLFLSFGFNLLAGYGLGAWYPVVFMRDLQMAPHEAGLALGGMTLVAAVLAGWGSGFLSDYFARRDPGGGRLRVIRVSMIVNAVAILPLIMYNQQLAVYGSFFGFLLVATVTGAITYTILPELVPTEARGQVIAIYIPIGYAMGLGTAPTMIALITDHLLRDPKLVSVAMIIVGIPSLLLAVILATIALPHARRLRERLIADGHSA